MSKFKALIEEARKPESHKDVRTENHVDSESIQIIDEVFRAQMVNLTIKVSIAERRHWVSKAKAEGTTITKEIVSALRSRFGQI